MSEQTEIPSKRGRKPFGDQAMTTAERKRLSRSRKADQGSAEIMVRLRGGTLNLIDQLANKNQVPRTEVIELLLDMALARVGNAAAEVELASALGATDAEQEALLVQALRVTPRPEAVDQYKRVMGIRHA
jgi:hypothetical protein